MDRLDFGADADRVFLLTWMKVLFKMNMTAVKYQAHFWPQKSICPMSQTSLTSGCRKQNSHSTMEL